MPIARDHAPVSILYDECLLTIVPAPPGIEKILTYTEKVMEKSNDPERPWERFKTKHYKVPLYTLLGSNPRILQTYAGLLDDIVAWCIHEGYNITRLHDDRPEFPNPRLDLMVGFRFKQRDLVTDFLLKKRSGMLEAPTRYGKTTCLVNLCRAFPNITTVIACPGIDLLRSLYRDVKVALPHREVKMIGGGVASKFPSEDITVASMDSLHKCDPGRTRLLLIDEPHAAVTDDRAREIVRFNMARKYSVGATLEGRFDGRDLLIKALLGPCLVRRTYTEAVAEGAICPIVVYMLKVKFSDFGVFSRQKAYNDLLFKSGRMAELTAKLCRELIPPDWQTLVFIKDEDQANIFLDRVGTEGVIAMAKKMKTTERKALLKLMEDNVVKRCLATKIYSTGVTFHDVRALINVEGGGGNIGAIQKPGRLAEIRPEKKCGVVFDFLFDCESDPQQASPPKEWNRRPNAAWSNIVRDSWSRYEVYKKKGYELHIVEGWNALATMFKERAL